MLLQVNVLNFALIEKLSISFEKGFNVFSGETGAGKSIMIDAISYVLGGKFNRDFIRTGEDKTYVEAVFSVQNDKTTAILKSLGIDFDDVLIISRETFSSGRSVVKVNGKAVIVSALKGLSSTLLDIHGQHENHNMLDSSNHINYLDYFSGEKLNDYFEKFSFNYNKLGQINSKIEALMGNDGEREKLINYLKYQIEEIDNAKLHMNEDEELKERFKLLTHSEKITKALKGSYSKLYDGTETHGSIYDELGSLIKDLRNIENYFDNAKTIANSLEDAYYLIEQSISDIRSVKDDIQYDDTELASINSRLYDIAKLKKKYGETIEEIILYRKKIQNDYEDLINSEDIINKLRVEYSDVQEKCKVLGEKIHNERVEAAKILQQKIEKELTYIGLEKSKFIIEVNYEDKINPKGYDRVFFMISTNPGEPVKSLEKVASGGELSRIMLALKTVFVDKDNIPTVIFDEIDTGISGRIAQRVAEKMLNISKKHQVLCITHLPQIASMSDQHYLVYKEVINNKTYTNINQLNSAEKEYEVAKMIGGSEVTKTTLENARELIRMSRDES